MKGVKEVVLIDIVLFVCFPVDLLSFCFVSGEEMVFGLIEEC